MARLAFRTQSPLNATVMASKRWVSSMGLWGASVGAGVVLLLSVTPLVRREVLSKTPLLRNYYEDKTPASDKPF